MLSVFACLLSSVFLYTPSTLFSKTAVFDTVFFIHVQVCPVTICTGYMFIFPLLGQIVIVAFFLCVLHDNTLNEILTVSSEKLKNIKFDSVFFLNILLIMLFLCCKMFLKQNC